MSNNVCRYLLVVYPIKSPIPVTLDLLGTWECNSTKWLRNHSEGKGVLSRTIQLITHKATPNCAKIQIYHGALQVASLKLGSARLVPWWAVVRHPSPPPAALGRTGFLQFRGIFIYIHTDIVHIIYIYIYILVLCVCICIYIYEIVYIYIVYIVHIFVYLFIDLFISFFVVYIYMYIPYVYINTVYIYIYIYIVYIYIYCIYIYNK